MDGAVVLALALVAFVAVAVRRRRGSAAAAPPVVCVDGHALPVQRWMVVPDATPDAVVSKAKGRRRAMLLVYGTRGDVQPMLALALALARTMAVTVCAPLCFEALVEQAREDSDDSAQLEFASAGVSGVDQPAAIFDRRAATFADVLGVLNAAYPDTAAAMLAACEARQPHVIVTTALARPAAMHIAERLRAPCVAAHFVASDEPTAAFPPVEYIDALAAAKAALPALAGPVNRLLYLWRGLQIVRGAVASGLAKSDDEFRTGRCALPKAAPLVALRDVQTQPALHAYSPHVCPPPADWPSHVITTGYWLLPSPSPSRASESAAAPSTAALLAFARRAAQAGRPLVFVTFGSMERVDALLAATVQALTSRLDCMVVVGDHRLPQVQVQPGREPTREPAEEPKREPAGGSPESPRVLTVVGSVTHAEVFPRCDLVVHHGGAGTTAAALRAGTPAVVVPVLQWSDQKAWAGHVQRLRCGVHLPRPADPTGDGEWALCLVDAARRAMACGQAGECENVARKLASEPDGAKVAASVIERYVHGIELRIV